MIFYTLHGPNYKLEIHDDKLKLTKKTWWIPFSSKDEILEWKLQDLSQFQIASPKFIWGKLEWSTFEGKKCTFRFTTNARMMVKIEKYVHKLIIKNFQRRQGITHQSAHLKLIENDPQIAA